MIPDRAAIQAAILAAIDGGAKWPEDIVGEVSQALDCRPREVWPHISIMLGREIDSTGRAGPLVRRKSVGT